MTTDQKRSFEDGTYVTIALEKAGYDVQKVKNALFNGGIPFSVFDAFYRALQSVPDGSRLFWVVEQIDEKNGNCLARYWDGGNSRSFTSDIHKAIQFCRKSDAFWVLRGWHWKDLKITEHMISAAQPAEREDE